MASFTISAEQPKCIVLFQMRISEEMDAFIDETKVGSSKSERVKDLISKGIVMEEAEKLHKSIGWKNLTTLANFFAQNSCTTFVLSVLPLSDPQARFLTNQGYRS